MNRNLILIGIAIIIGFLLCNCDGGGRTVQIPKETAHTENVNLSVEQKEPQYEYIGNVTAYCYIHKFEDISELRSSKELRLEKKGGDICAVIGNNRYHVTFTNVTVTIYGMYMDKKNLSFNATCTIDGWHYYFNY